jgi:hypothetical protein
MELARCSGPVYGVQLVDPEEPVGIVITFISKLLSKSASFQGNFDLDIE